MTNTAPDSLKIAIAQLNPVMGDLAANVLMARDARMEAKLLGADLVAFSELFISGYPPEDLIDKDAFLHACREACEELAKETEAAGPSILMGTPWLTDDGKRYNAVVLMEGGKVTAM
ncbi:MAG: nitrilase-related carbon-nitrogen hydrolase, partial [Hyphomicrobiales bacterium]